MFRNLSVRNCIMFKSVNWFSKQSIAGFYMIKVFTEKYFRTDYNIVFLQRYLYFWVIVILIVKVILITWVMLLNSSKWKALYWVECRINCYVYFNCLITTHRFYWVDCIKSVQIRSLYVSVSSRSGIEYGKIQTRKTPYLDTSDAVKILCFQCK